ncbi:4-oxalomesaconate tautomerase [Paenochrobactrum glaciei]|uniref:4-oxalomesaconate tautomerase n=1 Tax=Paenochrobactrum glaciei TaxID=486407 RepID=A0ABN1GFH8_9HYPH
MSDGIPCLWMRGGTSKGAYFLARDLPENETERDQLLLRIMGSPDVRQIDGIGGADPLTSKVAVISKSRREDADVDYLFLQVYVEDALVSSAQGCGNIIAGVGPFALERGLVKAVNGTTSIKIYMVNTGEIATAQVSTPNSKLTYEGNAQIDGVPGTHAPITLLFDNIAGSMTGALLPTGNSVDSVDGIDVTMIDNGMPIVVMRASDFGLTGQESRAELDSNVDLKSRIEAIRLKCGPLMNLGDVVDKSVPKMTLVSKPLSGGVISTRSFIPHRCHASIGVFAAVSIATACTLAGSPAAEIAVQPDGESFFIEHPSGSADVLIKRDSSGKVTGAGSLRTARKLFDGEVYPAPRLAT